MEDLKHIERLLEKYYSGETTLEEERELRWYFQTHKVPERLQPERKMHNYFQEKKKEVLSPGLTHKLSKLIDKQYGNRINSIKRTAVLWAGSAAAVAVIILTVWLGHKGQLPGKQTTFRDTYDDPRLAYLETKRVLALVSEKMNEGTRNLQALNKMNEGFNSLYPVFSFGPGIQHLNKLSKFDETIERITK